MVILGLDPGIERTGYAFFNLNVPKPKLLSYGCIETHKNNPIETRIGQLAKKLAQLIKKNRPNILAIEQVFFNTNAKSVIAVAQAQGAVLFLANEHNMKVYFLTPLQVKMSLTGYGRAPKLQVAKMLTLLLGLSPLPKPDDVCDAIACGLAYCYRSKLKY